MIRSLILLIFGGSLLLLAIRRLRQFKLKERHTLLFLLIGLPFLLLGVFPQFIEYLSKWSGIEQGTVMVLCVTIFLILMVFELLTIVSVQDRKITTLAQMVGILMEHQQLVDRRHEGINPSDQPGERNGLELTLNKVKPRHTPTVTKLTGQAPAAVGTPTQSSQR